MNPSKRELIKLFGVGGATLAISSYQPALGQLMGTPVDDVKATNTHVPEDDIESRTTKEDRQFRRVFKRALFRLRLRGVISRKQFLEIRAASFNSLGYKRDGRIASFLQHIRRDVEQRACGSFDDMLTAALMFAEAFVRWIVENWNELVKTVLGNLEALTIALEIE